MLLNMREQLTEQKILVSAADCALPTVFSKTACVPKTGLLNAQKMRLVSPLRSNDVEVADRITAL